MTAAAIQDAIGAFRAGPWGQGAAILAGALGLIAIVPEILTYPKPYAVDYHYFWAAGRVWFEGGSPYGPGFAEFFASQPIPDKDDIPRPFFYPPNAIALYWPLGRFDHADAWLVISLMNFLALALASYLFARLCRAVGLSTTYLYPALLHFGFICIGWSIGKILFVFAQPILVIYAGFLLVLLGALERRSLWLAIGLVICLLKPQIGLAVFFACLLHNRSRAAALAAGAVTALLCLVGFWSGGVLDNFSNYISGFNLYSNFYENQPERLSGLGYILMTIAGVDIGKLAPLGFLLVLIAVAAYRGRTSDVPQRDARLPELIIFSCVATLFFLPSHNNYYVPLTAALAYLVRERRDGDIVLLAAFALLTQSLSISNAWINVFGGALYETVALVDTVAIAIVFSIVFARYFGRPESTVDHRPARTGVADAGLIGGGND